MADIAKEVFIGLSARIALHPSNANQMAAEYNKNYTLGPIVAAHGFKGPDSHF